MWTKNQLDSFTNPDGTLDITKLINASGGSSSISTTDVQMPQLKGLNGAMIDADKLMRIDFAVCFGMSLRPAEETGVTELITLLMDGHVVYSNSQPTAAAPEGMSIQFYQGTDIQPIDPTMQAQESTLTPGFRNLIYVVVRGYPAPIGNATPPTCEAVLAEAASAAPATIEPFNVTTRVVHSLWQSKDGRYVYTWNYASGAGYTELIQYTWDTMMEIRRIPLFGPAMRAYVWIGKYSGGEFGVDYDNNLLIINTSELASNNRYIAAVSLSSGYMWTRVGVEGISGDFWPLDQVAVMKYRAMGEIYYGYACVGWYDLNFLGWAVKDEDGKIIKRSGRVEPDTYELIRDKQ